MFGLGFGRDTGRDFVSFPPVTVSGVGGLLVLDIIGEDNSITG